MKVGVHIFEFSFSDKICNIGADKKYTRQIDFYSKSFVIIVVIDSIDQNKTVSSKKSNVEIEIQKIFQFKVIPLGLIA